MPQTYDQPTYEEIKSRADRLLKAGERYAAIALQMKESGIDEVYTLWASANEKNLSIISGLSAAAVAMMHEQIEAHENGQPNPYKALKQRSVRSQGYKKSKKPTANKKRAKQ